MKNIAYAHFFGGCREKKSVLAKFLFMDYSIYKGT